MSDKTRDIHPAVQEYLNECENKGCEPSRATLYSLLLEARRLGKWPDEIDTKPSGNKLDIHTGDATNLKNVLGLLKNSENSLTVFKYFLEEYVESKNLDKAFRKALSVSSPNLKISLEMDDKEVSDFNKYLESQRIEKKMITFEKIDDMPHCGKRGDEIVGWILKSQNGCFKLKLRDVEYKLPSFLKACEKASELFEEEL